MEEESRNRADAIFALSRIPASARTFGAPAGWEAGLAERGVEIVAGAAELAVAAPDRRGEALASGARIVILDSGGARLPRALPGGRRLLPLPLGGSPGFYVDPRHRRAARLAVRRFGAAASGAAAARNRTAALAAGAGLLGRLAPLALLGDAGAAPAHLLAAAELGVSPGTQWAMAVSAGSPVRRDALLLLGAGSEPDRALKFARVPGARGAFEREERGLREAARAGGAVAAWAPRSLGSVEVAGRPGALQEAAPGEPLLWLLRSSAARERKLAAVQRVVDWLAHVAAQTAAPPETLERLRAELAQEARTQAPAHTEALVRALERLAGIPAVFRHGDLGEDNLHVDGRRPMALDWEWARPHGLPLADLAYFGARVCRLLDGAIGEHEREPHFRELMAGRAPSSPLLHGWLREAAAQLRIELAAVPALVSAALLEHARLGRIERERADRLTGTPHATSIPERTLSLWLDDPALGPAWPAFSPP